MKKRTPATLQKEYAADMKIFDWYGAALDQGKILLCILYENDPGGAMAYFFDEGQMPVENSDGLEVTSVDLEGNYPICTFGVHR